MLLGALQWPATQGAFQLSCSVSMLQGTLTKATVRDIREANKLLRFAKTNKDVRRTFPRRRYDLGFSALSDMATRVTVKVVTL